MPDYPFHYDMPATRDCDSEILIQKAMRDRIAMELRYTTSFAVPNANKRTRWQAQQAKREGMTKGVTDLVIVGFPKLVAFVEVKAKETLTADQREFLETMHQMGHLCGCFRSQDTLIAKLKEWGFS